MERGAGPLRRLEEDALFSTVRERLGPAGKGKNFLHGECIAALISGSPLRGLLISSSNPGSSLGMLPPWPRTSPGSAPAVTVLFPGDGRRVTLIELDGSMEDRLASSAFPVAAMACDLNDPTELIDPFGGAEDLESRTLRALGEPRGMNALVAVALCSAFSLQPDDDCLEALKRCAPGLARERPRRVFANLARVMSAPGLSSSARMMKDVGVLDAVLPEVATNFEVPQNYYHHLGVWGHTLEVLDRLEEIMSDPRTFLGPRGRLLAGHLARVVACGFDRRTLIALAALVHDCGKALTMKVEDSGRIRFKGHAIEGARLVENVSRRLEVPNRGRRYLVSTVRNHMRLGYLLKEGETEATRLGVVRELGDSTIDVAVLSLADRLATKGEASRPEGVERYQRTVRRVLADFDWDSYAPPLAGGRDVVIHAGLEGQDVGRALLELRVAQKESRVVNRQQALEFIAPDFKGNLSP